MTIRSSPVVELAGRVPPGPTRQIMDVLQRVLGKTVSLASVSLVNDLGGVQVTNAATTPGSDVTEARAVVHLADAGIDQLRLVVRGKNSASGAVVVEAYRVSGGETLASVTVTDGSLATFLGDWTTVIPTGEDEEIGLRIVGDGAFDPTVYRVDMQMRTLRAAT